MAHAEGEKADAGKLSAGGKKTTYSVENSKKMEGWFSAEYQNNLNSAQHLVAKLTSSPAGRDR